MSFPSKRTLRSSGLLFSILIVILFAVLPYILHNEVRVSIFILSLAITSISLLSPYSLRRPYDLWLKFGSILGKVNLNIVLVLFFYLIITPVAIVKKIIGFFIKKFSKNDLTYYSKKQLSTKINFKDLV